MPSVHAVIMAGGSGTRFWPASRQDRPKQLLPLLDDKPMLQAAVERVADVCPADNVWIVTNPKQKKAIGKLLLDFPVDRILVEPEARDTAPCIAFAMAAIAARDPDATLVVLPADQVVAPVSEFTRMAARARELAADRKTLVTFGVPPRFPATGYGYIELGEPRDDARPRAFAVRSFREKPDAATARRLVDDGGFWWNSGILVFHLDAMQVAMAAHAPDLAAATDRMRRAIAEGRRGQVTRAFKRAPKTSIDYAIMEKAEHLAVVECTAHWDDVGSFPALARVLAGDAHGNHLSLHDGAAATLLESHGNIVYAEGRRTVALFGVEGLVVAAVGDAVLVCPKEQAADLKRLVERLRAEQHTDLL
ncbi:MAG TPA: mannose-1-phosphate guanylyltransferase [bacterium]|nr:mannose-1-phosphate guanylyltransferase [bacterium]